MVSVEERLIHLETTVAFQEDLLSKLNELVSKQQLELHQLERLLEELRAQLRELQPSTVRDAAEEPPPPHY